MNIRIIALVVIIILLIIFAVQNAGEVILKFFGKQFTGSLSLFLILSILLGAIIGSLFTLSFHGKTKKENNDSLNSNIKNDSKN